MARTGRGSNDKCGPTMPRRRAEEAHCATTAALSTPRRPAPSTGPRASINCRCSDCRRTRGTIANPCSSTCLSIGSPATAMLLKQAIRPDFVECLWAKGAPLLRRLYSMDEGHGWWQSNFGGDAGVLGRTIELSGHHFAVVGVMPPHFQFPYGGVKFWLPSEPLRLPPGWGTGPNT